MGIFSRIGDVLKANINDMIDRAEDPEKMVKQIILDLQKEVSKATQALGKAMASERIAKRQYEDAVKTSSDWEMKAKAALNAGEVDLAKKALSNKVKADENVKQYQQMYEQISAQTAQLREQVEALKSKLDEAKSRQAMLIARSQMAKTQKNLAQSVGGMDASSALDKFNRMEEKVTRQEAEHRHSRKWLVLPALRRKSHSNSYSMIWTWMQSCSGSWQKWVRQKLHRKQKGVQFNHGTERRKNISLRNSDGLGGNRCGRGRYCVCALYAPPPYQPGKMEGLRRVRLGISGRFL